MSQFTNYVVSNIIRVQYEGLHYFRDKILLGSIWLKFFHEACLKWQINITTYVLAINEFPFMTYIKHDNITHNKFCLIYFWLSKNPHFKPEHLLENWLKD